MWPLLTCNPSSSDENVIFFLNKTKLYTLPTAFCGSDTLYCRSCTQFWKYQLCAYSVSTHLFMVKATVDFRNIYSIFFSFLPWLSFKKKILPRWAFIEGTDTEFEVMTVTQLTPKWLRIGCGDLWECVVSQSWPKTRYNCLTYHGTTQLTWNYEVIHWSFNTGSKSVPCPHGTSVRFN